jgi:hypothetical protein
MCATWRKHTGLPAISFEACLCIRCYCAAQESHSALKDKLSVALQGAGGPEDASAAVGWT